MSNKNENTEGIVKTISFFAICLVTALIGSTSPGWLYLFMPLALGGFAYWVSGKGGKYGLFGAGLGLVFAFLINTFAI